MIEDVDIGWERNDAVPICTLLFVPGNVFLHDIVQNNRGYKVAHHTVDSKMKSVYV
jgi:hypothetical protein